MRLWIRADGSAELGLGHVMRTLAVAERAQDRRLEVRYLVGGSVESVALVTARGFAAEYVDDQADPVVARMRPGDAVIFDGYRFSAELMQSAREVGCRVAAIDDLGGGCFPVDVLLNQNPLTSHDYLVPAGGCVLLGPRYALVRREFVRRRRLRHAGHPHTLLVTMGGSDVAGLTAATIELAASRPAFDRVVLVVGPAARLERSATLPPGVEVLRAPSDVGAVFDTADAAITAAGSTTWELLCMGIPTALVEVADNQAATGVGVHAAEAGIHMGEAAAYPDAFAATVRRLADPAVRRHLSQRALALVDGDGADRLLAALLG